MPSLSKTICMDTKVVAAAAPGQVSHVLEEVLDKGDLDGSDGHLGVGRYGESESSTMLPCSPATCLTAPTVWHTWSN